jgi:hypothetical protein
MRIPNADRAIVAAEKLSAYLLNVSHKRGARLLLSVGYRSDEPRSLLMHPLLLHAPPTTHLGSRPRFLLNRDIYL